MPILNYTTKIEPRRTAAEISDVLVDAGAQGVLIEYDKERIPTAVTFKIQVQGRWWSYRLPSQWQGVYKLITEQHRLERRYRTQEQAQRITWRIIKDWIEAQLAIVQAEVAELPEVFLPYAVDPKTGYTLFEKFKGGNLLGSGDEPIDGEYKEIQSG